MKTLYALLKLFQGMVGVGTRTTVPDPWEGGSSSYVNAYRGVLEEIARTFSQSAETYHVRFNQETGHAEIYTLRGGVQIEVEVRGKAGAVDRITVSVPRTSTLTDPQRKVFEQIFRDGI